MDRLSQERRRVAVIVAQRLGDREHLDPQPLAQHLLVAAGLDLVPRETRGVVDEYDVEAPRSSVGHQTLKLRPRVCLLPAGVEVAVLADEVEPVLGREGADRFALRVRREALTLLLGRLAHVRDRARHRFRRHLAPQRLPARRAQVRA